MNDVASKKTSIDGLDYSDIDTTTPEEVAAFREYMIKSKGHSLPAHEFMLEFRPDVIKTFRNWIQAISLDQDVSQPLPNTMAMLHYYAITGFEEGIEYEIRLSQYHGATKAEVLDLLAIAAIHGHTRGTRSVAVSSTECMRTYQDPPKKDRWPSNWTFGTEALRTGIDYTTQRATGEEIDSILHWYQSALGEIPRHIAMLAEFRPHMLKAYRKRYETAIRGGLPQQMMPYLLLHWNTMTGRKDGIRENVLLGSHLGMTYSQITDAIFRAIYNSPESFAIVDEAAGEILRKLKSSR